MNDFKIQYFEDGSLYLQNSICVGSLTIYWNIAHSCTVCTPSNIQFPRLSRRIFCFLPLICLLNIPWIFYFFFQQAKLNQMTAELTSKTTVLTSALEIAKEMSDRIKTNNLKKNGLCIRLLNKKNLQHVLGYLGPESSVITVCKYWRLCLKKQEIKIENWELVEERLLIENTKKNEMSAFRHPNFLDIFYLTVSTKTV